MSRLTNTSRIQFVDQGLARQMTPRVRYRRRDAFACITSMSVLPGDSAATVRLVAPQSQKPASRSELLQIAADSDSLLARVRALRTLIRRELPNPSNELATFVVAGLEREDQAVRWLRNLVSLADRMQFTDASLRRRLKSCLLDRANDLAESPGDRLAAVAAVRRYFSIAGSADQAHFTRLLDRDTDESLKTAALNGIVMLCVRRSMKPTVAVKGACRSIMEFTLHEHFSVDEAHEQKLLVSAFVASLCTNLEAAVWQDAVVRLKRKDMAQWLKAECIRRSQEYLETLIATKSELAALLTESKSSR